MQKRRGILRACKSGLRFVNLTENLSFASTMVYEEERTPRKEMVEPLQSSSEDI